MMVSQSQLPPGVKDLATWGRTVCTLPRVGARKMSYDEMAIDEGADMVKYLDWTLCNKNNGKSPKVASYLKAIKWRDASSGDAVPGTAERRVYKDLAKWAIAQKGSLNFWRGKEEY